MVNDTHTRRRRIRQQQRFAFSRPSVWNSLSPVLCDYSLSLNIFKQKLKTHLFGQWRTSPGAAVALLWFLTKWHKSSDLLTYLRSSLMLLIDRSRMSHYQWCIATVPLITKTTLGRVHVPPTKLFLLLAVNKTVVKPRVAAAQYL